MGRYIGLQSSEVSSAVADKMGPVVLRYNRIVADIT